MGSRHLLLRSSHAGEGGGGTSEAKSLASQPPRETVRADACRGCGLSERDTAVAERKGHKKEHEWVLVSKSLTIRAGEVI